jgi:hypothetical protein
MSPSGDVNDGDASAPETRLGPPRMHSTVKTLIGMIVDDAKTIDFDNGRLSEDRARQAAPETPQR